MKKLVLSLTVFIASIISYAQGGLKPNVTNTAIGESRTIDGLRRLCTNTLDISTPTGWVPVGSIPTSVTTFANHQNWIAFTSPQQNKTYQFKRKFYIGRAGTYNFNVQGMGDNKMVLTVNSPTPTTLIDYDVPISASGFNTPPKVNTNIELQCGVYELTATIANYTGPAGFYVDGSITSKEGCIGDEKVACEVQREVCRCPEGWQSNSSGKEGDITTDGKCKKFSCNLAVSPHPSNGTSVGTYGFTWGGELWVWGSKENKGGPICKKEWVVLNPKEAAKQDVEGRGEK
jgi:hypothetical protein